MGIAASLFFNTDDPQNCLDWRIRPSDEQYDSQKNRWNTLAKFLLNSLNRDSNCPTSSWLQGSYKFGTQIRPANKDHEFDIDLGVYFHWEAPSEKGEWSPIELKEMVQNNLEAYIDLEDNDAEAVSEPKERCNRIHFADNFHIDVPSYHWRPERDVRMLATQSDTWELSDPRAIYDWWKDTVGEDARPRVRRLVRYLKIWAALQFDEGMRPSSILLTVLTAQAYSSLDTNRFSGDDEFFAAIVERIHSRLCDSDSVPNPANTDENLNRLSSYAVITLLSRLETLSDLAERALASSTQAQAADIWAQAFEHFFPVPEDDEVVAEASKMLIPIQFAPDVEVVATTRGQNARQFHGMNSIGPIPKDCDIKFELANAGDLPFGASVFWTVRNEGDEAEGENDLGHIAGEGLTAHETSSYKGRHYMDVAIKLNGVLIGRRRVPVVIMGSGLPPRNPKKRPEYVKYRRKRR